MCTATWFARDDGYEFFFNRDESRGRLPASAPAIREGDGGVRFIAPADGNHGGSWIAVNDRGLAVGLLNRYEVPFDRARTYRSRGLLVTDLASSPDADACERRLRDDDPARYPPFRLILLTPGARTSPAPVYARIFASDGARITEESAEQPVVSSSWPDLALVCVRRAADYDAMSRPGTRAELRDAHLRLHHSHGDGPSAYSVCMHRDNAETRNFSHVIVASKTVALRQKPDAPCRSDYLPDVVLKRVRKRI